MCLSRCSPRLWFSLSRVREKKERKKKGKEASPPRFAYAERTTFRVTAKCYCSSAVLRFCNNIFEIIRSIDSTIRVELLRGQRSLLALASALITFTLYCSILSINVYVDVDVYVYVYEEKTVEKRRVKKRSDCSGTGSVTEPRNNTYARVSDIMSAARRGGVSQLLRFGRKTTKPRG